MATKFLKLNRQYITDDQVIGLVGSGKTVNIKAEDVSAEFTPIVISNSTLPKNPMVKLQNLQNLKAMVDKEQKVQVNTAPIWKEMVSTLGLTDIDEIVPSDRDEAIEENELLVQGEQVVECEVSDNQDVHITIHQYELIKGELDPEAAQRFMDHIKAHKLWKIAADPELLEKMGPQQTPPELPCTLPTPGDPQSPPVGQPAGFPGLPNPSAAVNEAGLIDQISAQFAQQGQPLQPPVPFPGVRG